MRQALARFVRSLHMFFGPFGSHQWMAETPENFYGSDIWGVCLRCRVCSESVYRLVRDTPLATPAKVPTSKDRRL